MVKWTEPPFSPFMIKYEHKTSQWEKAGLCLLMLPLLDKYPPLVVQGLCRSLDTPSTRFSWRGSGQALVFCLHRSTESTDQRRIKPHFWYIYRLASEDLLVVSIFSLEQVVLMEDEALGPWGLNRQCLQSESGVLFQHNHGHVCSNSVNSGWVKYTWEYLDLDRPNIFQMI